MSKKHETKSDDKETSKTHNSKSKNKYIVMWKKMWNFIWNDDSIWSWIVNIALAFVIIKFVVYPVLGLLFATNFPIVAVVSGSMEHAYAPRTDNLGYPVEQNGQLIYGFCQDTKFVQKSFINTKEFRDFDTFWDLCGKWYVDRNITYEQFKKFPFTNGFNKGDIMILYGAKLKNIKVGDIIVFKGNLRADPIIHRVVAIRVDEIGDYHFTTKGDHNENIFVAIGENDIGKDKYLAKAVLNVPYLGWIKIWFTYVITGFKPIH